jgi:plasmid stabilization system protein ParE
MILEVLPSANEEIELSYLFYEAQRLGLGVQFLNAVEDGYHRLLANPKAWSLLPSSTRFRRCLLRGFSYGLIYVVKEQKITIVAVMHLARKPGYWHKRRST